MSIISLGNWTAKSTTHTTHLVPERYNEEFYYP